MRRSQLHAPTIRENPTEAETVSHRLLLRAGFIRPLSSGIYSMLPLGLRVKRKLENIIREELNNIGALEFDLPIAFQRPDSFQTSAGCKLGRSNSSAPMLFNSSRIIFSSLRLTRNPNGSIE